MMGLCVICFDIFSLVFNNEELFDDTDWTLESIIDNKDSLHTSKDSNSK